MARERLTPQISQAPMARERLSLKIFRARMVRERRTPRTDRKMAGEGLPAVTRKWSGSFSSKEGCCANLRLHA